MKKYGTRWARIIAITVPFMLGFFLSLLGNNSDISLKEQITEVPVRIVASYRNDGKLRPVFKDKKLSLVRRPDQFEVTVEYAGDHYVIEDETIYYQFFDRVGDEVIGVLQKQSLSDGAVTKRFIDLKDVEAVDLDS